MSGCRSSSSYSHVVPDLGAPPMMNVGPRPFIARAGIQALARCARSGTHENLSALAAGDGVRQDGHEAVHSIVGAVSLFFAAESRSSLRKGLEHASETPCPR